MTSTIPSLERLQIPLEEVVKATNNFDDNYVIGKGDFGKVYRGQLLVSGEMVNIAARRLDPKRRRQGDVEFWTEISVLSSLKHENIASLIGFCDENGEKIIINKDEATRGSLSMYLSDPTTLTWIQRLKICVGVARALRYIRNSEGRGYSVIHRNINSFTVLLDDNLDAKLSGFEYSIKQSVDRMDRVVLSDAIAPKGYKDPSILKTGGVSHKSDIYSFGVVLCEMLCGRKAFIPDAENRFLAILFRIQYEKRSLNDIILPDLRHQMTQKSLTEISRAAYCCLKENRLQRPKMDDIVIELEKALELEILIKELKHLKIPLSNIMSATENFSEACRIRDTGHYDLYKAELEHFDEENFSSKEGKNKGELPRLSNTVFINRFHQSDNDDSNIGQHMFYTGIKMLDTCKHPNIVKLLGFCDEGSEMILVIENLCNGYLDECLRNTEMMHTLTWAKRLKICLDVANALNYIHYEMEDNMMIIHRDIKSPYIAMDEKWGSKIIDFGLSVLLPPYQVDEGLNQNTYGGTPCYADPEYTTTGKVKREIDVYSFGVVLFEVLCGRPAYDPIYLKESNEGLAVVARRWFQDGTPLMEMIDPILKEQSDENNFIIKKGPNKYSLEKFVKLAHECIAENQDQRPTMKVVVKELQEALLFEDEQLDVVHVADEVEELMELKPASEENFIEHLKIPLIDIVLATDNFSPSCQIRAELTYNLYRGNTDYLYIEEECNTVVIKRFLLSEDDIGEEKFFTEIKMLTTCNHPNIVKLIGICDEGSEMILVVEHPSNGYLYDYLWYEANDKRHILTWATRLKICLDVANALNYLHTEMDDKMMIIHRDIKSANIAFDENWEAKIVDFRVSVFLPPNQEEDALRHSFFIGTPEYMDPIYRKTGKLKRESDVYSFGVVLLEILCGKLANDPAVYLKESEQELAFEARQCFREGTLAEMIDPILKEQKGENSFILKRGPNKVSLEKFIKIAHECIAETQDERPKMEVVVKELQEALFFEENKDEPIISLEVIKLATENFDDKNYIGGGGFGKVYKGKVPHGDGLNTIVVKRLDTRPGQGEQLFRTELQILFEYKHENIISLVGYCNEEDEKIIVFEHASRGSLDGYLKDIRLTWIKRLNICIDVATALAFLHGGAGKQAIVIHRDIKPANILLDAEWNAKLAALGLSLISAINQETDYAIEHPCGTTGYLDPLYLKSGFLTKESDIYSLGVVLFEIMCGKSTFEIYKRNGQRQHLSGFIKEAFKKGKGKLDDLVFKALKDQIVPEALTAFQAIAYRCLHDDRKERPTATEVLEQLKKAREFQISGSIEVAAHCMEVQLNI
uniref:uncharacterized protein LOC122583696 n=1 Tax=Erigeron canadensis TaxID=72917 RepID=UPI001CB95D87|nr:uncharacterized protein LOC122583696 [Erigeron canadensis]